MKKQVYHRPRLSTSTRRKKSDGKKVPWLAIFLKLLLWGLVAGACFGLYVFSVKVYHAVSSSQIVDWHVKEIKVSGVTGNLAKSLNVKAETYKDKPFSVEDSLAFRKDIVASYPMLKDVTVKRDLLNGILKVSASHRTPIAKFKTGDGLTKYIDSDCTIYMDENPDLLQPVPFVEIIGTIPEKLSKEFIDLLEASLKLNKELDFAFLTFNLNNNTVDMHMPDGCIIDFGPAANLKQKAQKASQIITYAKEHNFSHPYRLNFQFYEHGKVFLTKMPH